MRQIHEEALTGGDGRAELDLWLPEVYAELRVLARRQLRGERGGHTLDSVALVHEAYLKLARQPGVHWESRAHFFAILSRSMRAVLVDYARARARAKRRPAPGDLLPTGGASDPWGDEDGSRVLELHEAMLRLQAVSAEAARVAESHCFAGLTLEETARAMGLSLATARRRWAFAKAWLHRDLSAGG